MDGAEPAVMVSRSRLGAQRAASHRNNNARGGWVRTPVAHWCTVFLRACDDGFVSRAIHLECKSKIDAVKTHLNSFFFFFKCSEDYPPQMGLIRELQ